MKYKVAPSITEIEKRVLFKQALALLFFLVLDYDNCSETREDKLNWLEIVF